MHILLVDDEPVQRQLLKDFLEEKGYNVIEAEDGQKAISIFKKNFIPLVLLDHRMPEMTGDEVLKELKKINPLVKVIMITAYGAVDTAVKVMKLGAFDFLEKPVDLNKLLAKIDKALEDVEIEKDIEELATQQESDPSQFNFSFIGKSKEIKEAISIAKRIAPTSWPVLIYGETGTGKELMARLIHELSSRRNAPFIPINCATFSENLFESELFGHVKGAFTGANKDKKGLFEEANGGTIFLDEIGEIPISLQAKLLRVLQEQTILRVGSTKPIKIDVRVISATNRNLKEMIEQGKFRQDLYYRLNVFELNLPPLRERKEDIPELVEYFIKKYSTRPISISSSALDLLIKYNWPGNIRELEHVIQRAVTLSRGSILKEGDFHLEADNLEEINLPLQHRLETVEKKEILKALEKANWVQTRAAKLLGISERVLRYKMKKFGIKKRKD